MDKAARVRQLMPLIEQIKNKKLREGAVACLVKVWEESEWSDLNDCPFNLHVADCTLVEHVNFVIESCIVMADITQRLWQTPIDRDLLIAGAALHDLSKFLELAPAKGKRGKYSEIGENLVHCAYGVHIALNAGLPMKLVGLINTHTPKVKMLPNAIEGIFIIYADMATADMFHKINGKPLHLTALK